jgi:hypothetical protein
MNTLNTTKEEVSAEAIPITDPNESYCYSKELQVLADKVMEGYEPRGSWKREYDYIPLYDKETVGEMLCRMVEEYASTVLSSQSKDEKLSKLLEQEKLRNEFTFPYLKGEHSLQIERMKDLGISVNQQTFEQCVNTVLRMAENWASSQKGEEAPLYKQFYDRIHGGRNELEWLQINKTEFADFVVRTFDYFEQQVNKKGE